MKPVSQANGTVATTGPLTVVVDGHSTAVPAAVLNAAAYAVDDRVSLLVRAPLKPLILGKES